MLCLFLVALTSIAWSMGEKLEKTENGTPVLDTASKQFTYAQEMFVRAQRKSTTENIQKASNAFYDFRKLFPQNKKRFAQSYYFEGKLHLIKAQDNKAQALFTKFIAQDKDRDFPVYLAEAQYLLGNFLQKEKKYKQAIPAYKKVEDNYPKQTKWIIQANQSIADCQLALGEIPSSIKTLEDTLIRTGLSIYDQAYLQLKLGLLYQRIGKLEKAKLSLNKVLNYPSSKQLKGPQTAAKFALEEIKKMEKRSESVTQ
ncbi:tetratricopeptide repeat protein [Candidatus Margulisiibacteriota bacterium]